VVVAALEPEEAPVRRAEAGLRNAAVLRLNRAASLTKDRAGAVTRIKVERPNDLDRVAPQHFPARSAAVEVRQ